MKERPILFSGPMVRAILEGRKTVTRRAMSPQPEHAQIHVWNGRTIRECESRAWCWRDRVFHDAMVDCHGTNTLGPMLAPFCPHGAPGDRLWVRETFAESVPGCEEQGGFSYRSDHVDPRGDGPAHPMTWRPSIFMPRAASRITLDVVSVRAERLQDITDEEIAAEGVTMQALIDLGVPSFPWPAAPLDLWRLGWNAINGKRAPWEANPWVWRVEFRRCP